MELYRSLYTLYNLIHSANVYRDFTVCQADCLHNHRFCPLLGFHLHELTFYLIGIILLFIELNHKSRVFLPEIG